MAWTTAFDYENDGIGPYFLETVRQPDPDDTEPSLAFAESVASPYSYASVTWGSPNQRTSRVYLRSDDDGATLRQTGRAPENVGCHCNIGFAGGR